MRRIARLVLPLALILLLVASPAGAAGTRVIVRVSGGLPVIQWLCGFLGCTVNYGLGDPAGEVFLVTTANPLPNSFLNALSFSFGVISAELDVKGSVLEATINSVPPALYDNTPVTYYGTTVWNGYVSQPASRIVRVADAHGAFNVSGRGIVAVIDTGVDVSHPVLQPVLLPGRDFTRDRDGADEKGDVSQSTAEVVDGAGPTYVNRSTIAVVNQSTAEVVDTDDCSAFGHGTMVAGVVHLVAPNAMILPVKAFNADGTGYLSDAIRSVYWAVNHDADVLNMSFSFANTSREFSNALRYANRQNVIAVASAGNDGADMPVYPAAYAAYVMGVASTTDDDSRSTFSNYGQPQVWVAAPGEGIVTTYPWGTYAAVSGTSFSAPFVAGAAALLLDVYQNVGESAAANSVAHAKYISPELGNGRLDVYQAVAAWRNALGW